MAHIGNAYMDVVPKFPGLESSVKRAMASIDTSSIGTQMGTSVGGGFKGGFAKAGAIAGIVSSMASQVTSQIGSHMASAISRFDTLNNYPKVMEALGYTSKQATESIDLMSERLQVLPTRLDAMVSTVQGFTSITGDIDKSTKLGLALNDALLAGGQGAEVASAAAEQFRQILAKGKPEMQDWRSLTTAAPGQIDMLAKSLLGASASANDLYLAIGGGDQKHYDGPKIAMDEFIDKIIELDEVGANGLASFQKQAEDATGGLKTQLDNLSNAWTRGLADTFDVFGTDRVAAIISDLKGGIKEGFSGFNDALFEELPRLDGLYATVKDTVGEITPLAGDLMESLAPIGSALVDNFAPAAEDVTDSIKTVVDVAKDAIDTVGPFATDVIGGLASHAGDIAVFAGSFSLLQAAGGKFQGFVGTVKQQSGILKGSLDAFRQGFSKSSSANVITEVVEATEAAEKALSTKSMAGSTRDLYMDASNYLSGLSGKVEDVEDRTNGLRDAFSGAKGAIEQQNVALETASQGYMTLRDAVKLAQNGTGDWSDNLDKFTPTVKTMADVAKGSAESMGGAFSGVKGKIKDMASSAKTNLKSLASGIAGFMGAGGLGIVLTGVSLIGSAVATAMVDAKEKADNFKGATEGLKAAVQDTANLNTYASAIEKVGDSAEISIMSVEDLAESASDLADNINQRNKTAQTEISKLERARTIIDGLAGRDDWTASETGQAKWAIDQLNDSLGLTLTLEDVKTDKWTNEQQEVKDLTDTIDELIDKKKQEIRQNAISANLSDLYQQQTENSKTYTDALAAQKKAQEELDKYDAEHTGADFDWSKHNYYQAQLDSATQKVEEAKGIYDSNTEAIKTQEEAMDRSAEAASESADAWTRLKSAMTTSHAGVAAAFQGTDKSIDKFTEDLQSLGLDADALANDTSGVLEELAVNYDGTAASLVGSLTNIDKKFGDSAQTIALNAKFIPETIQAMGDEAEAALGDINIDEFSTQLAAAGISTDQLANYGAENFTRLATACNGNIDTMIWAIQNYNAVPIANKDGSVSVDDAQLIDAQGRVIVWNGTDLVYKDTGAEVDDQDLLDAQGHVWEWNGSTLEPKTTTATAFGNVIDGSALSAVDRLKTALSGLHDKTINIRQYETIQKETRYITSTQNGGTTTGGARRDAAGGVMFRAEGYIANRAGTGVNIGTDRNGVTHYAGEAGAEAIVPLTNKRYAMPFADLIAELVAGRQDTGTQYNLYIDGASLAADKAASAAMEDLARVLMRRARTTRR